MIFINEEEGFPMKRRVFSLLLTLGLLCSLLPAVSAEDEEAVSSFTALCVAKPGQSVFLDEKEFQLLCRQATGHDLESVAFSSLSAGVGKLTCRGEGVTAADAYYMYRSPAISDVCFTPYAYSSTSRFVGQAEMAFTMTSDKEETVSGTLILYVPETPTQAEEPSLMDKALTVKAGKPVDLFDHLPSTVRYKKGTTIYIGEAITSATFQLPSSSQGSLWLDYDHPEIARKLLPDEVLFPDKAPNYYNLTFVPTSREETEVRLVHTISSEKKDFNVCLTLNFKEDKEPVRPGPDIPPACIVSPVIHFQDMAGWEWAVPAAEFLGKSGYFSNETAFDPGGEAKRMDLIHALALTTYSNFRRNMFPTPAFSDLPDDPELVQSVAALADRGLVLGNGEGLFLPDEHITRQDALVILYRAMADRSKLLPLYGDLSAFSDAGDVAPYAQEAVTLLAARGIVLGDGTGNLDPLSPITRAEMACLLYRAFG